MRSVTTSRFRKSFAGLPPNVKETARKAYKQWKENPKHPGLKYKQIHKTELIYSVRIGISWRALGVKKSNTMIWFWIGSHEEYNKLIASL